METREEQQWARDAWKPDEAVNSVVEAVLELPIGGQVQALRRLVRRIVPAMRHEERANFYCDLEDDFFH